MAGAHPAVDVMVPETRHGCRWPMWGHKEPPTHLYCGARRGQWFSSYCPAHHALAFISPALLGAEAPPVAA